jgi:hypothetical protein
MKGMLQFRSIQARHGVFALGSIRTKLLTIAEGSLLKIAYWDLCNMQTSPNFLSYSQRLTGDR